jgi:putative Mg2+ transporter-C (MgtC) family protein
MYAVSLTVIAMGIAALTVLRRFEDKNDHLLRRRVSVAMGDDETGIGRVVAVLVAVGATVTEVEYERRLDDDKKRVVGTFDVQFVHGERRELIESIESVQGVRRVWFQQPT